MGHLSHVVSAEHRSLECLCAQVQTQLDFLQQPSEAYDALSDASEAQCQPKRCLVAANHWFLEVLLEGLQDSDGRQPCAAQEHPLSIGRICLPRQPNIVLPPELSASHLG